jgi:hypothetical protein
MSDRPETTTIDTGRSQMSKALAHYDVLAAGGEANTEAEQGFDNWVRTDPREWRNLSSFLDQVRASGNGTHVLMGGCSDGLAAQTLAEEGFVPTGYDFSSEMVKASRKRLAQLGLHGAFYQGDATDLDLSLYPDTFAGATFMHVANCLPVAGKNDDLLSKALLDLSSRAPKGPFYVPTTYYPEPIYNRELVLEGREIGIVPYYSRPVEKFQEILSTVGRVLLHTEHFDAREADEDDPGYGYDYINDYMLFGPATVH